MENEKNLRVIYKYDSKIIGGIVGLVLIAMPLISHIISCIKSSQNKFYDYITHEVITPGFSMSDLVGSIILLIIYLVVLIIAIKHIKISYYEIICPYCGKVTYIKTDATAADCPICEKRIVMENGEPQTINNEI